MSWALPVERLRHVAVVTEDLKTLWKPLCCKPPVDRAPFDDLPVFGAIVVDVVDAQEGLVLLAATGALMTVVIKNLFLTALDMPGST
jgi:hypothetical protein